MVTLEQKLALFRKMVEEKVQKEADEQIRRKEEEIASYLEEEKSAWEHQVQRSEKAAAEKIKRQRSETLSSQIQKRKKEMLQLQEDLLDDLLKKVEARAEDFSESEEYPVFVAKSFGQILRVFEERSALTIYLAPASFVKAKEAMEEVLSAQGRSCIFREGEASYIGGFIAENEGRTLRVNKTLAEGIRRKREEIGRLLYEEIHREG